ncbi:formimidoylglutamase [Phaeocystidibacter luteus]|uniref:Formimidoylglutamase n=1 Tax=Phaeocystidibacter luteus TaxID=911197 RepID=A0A6N6RFH1_9FLAO|nr:formimidoylglutamase [Phaeocystidibacter luteus]KAB2809905.1 formimidoylglutamase [Phaeocystidibacter luteus]
MEQLLNLFDRPFVLSHTSVRGGEEKIGQTAALLENEGNLADEMKASKAKFAVVFIPEDVGVRANCGRPGASATWEPALKGICNLQDNYWLRGEDILLVGAVATDDLMEEAAKLREDTTEGLAALRELTSELDDRVRTVIGAIHKAGLFPIVIGGGHNNAYPLLAAYYDTHDGVLSAINLDPHADYRAMEGRHSGNGFRYAHEEGILDRYAILGLHEGYNSAEMMSLLRDDPDLRYVTFEDIEVRRIISFNQALVDSVDFVSEEQFGIELDLDSIPGVAVSAATPTGVSLEKARHFVYTCAKRETSKYLHICEGSAGLASDRQLTELSKVIACLVADGIKGKNESE